MNTAEKIQILVKHWIAHNAEHEEEFRKWAERAEAAAMPELAADLAAAAGGLREAARQLRTAQVRLNEARKDGQDVPEHGLCP